MEKLKEIWETWLQIKDFILSIVSISETWLYIILAGAVFGILVAVFKIIKLPFKLLGWFIK